MKYRKLSLLTLLCAGLFALGLTLTATPEAVEAGQCLPCSLGPTTTTPPLTVADNVNCAWSITKAQNMLLNQYTGGCTDGFCTKEFITVSACSESDPNHLVTLKLRFKCKECIQFPDL